MIQCTKLSAYLDRELSEAEQQAFVAHAATCPECTQQIEKWKVYKNDVKGWAADVGPAVPSKGEAVYFVQRLHSQKRSKSAARNRILVAAAVSCAAALLLLWLPGKSDSPATPRVHSSTPAITVKTRSYVLESTGQDIQLHKVGKDQLGLDIDTTVKVIDKGDGDIECQLIKGTLAAHAHKRKNGHQLRIVAGVYVVQVIGTRFLTMLGSNNGVLVSVLEGTVKVTENTGRSWVLHAGQSLNVEPKIEAKSYDASSKEQTRIRGLLGAIDTEPGDGKPVAVSSKSHTKTKKSVSFDTPAPVTADYSSWRKKITQGKLEETSNEIGNYLTHHSADSKAWMLLADCHRKMNNWEKAVQSYERAIETGSPSKGNMARYLAATLLQDELGNHQAAIGHLRKYLKGGTQDSDLGAMAKVKLARSLVATGKTTEAKRLLQEITATQQSDSLIYKNANQLLSTIK